MRFEILKLLHNRWMILCTATLILLTTGMYCSTLYISESGNDLHIIQEYYKDPQGFLSSHENMPVLEAEEKETVSRMLQQRDYQQSISALLQENSLKLSLGLSQEKFLITSMEKAQIRYRNMQNLTVPLSFHGSAEAFLSSRYSVIVALMTGICSCMILLSYDHSQPSINLINPTLRGGKRLMLTQCGAVYVSVAAVFSVVEMTHLIISLCNGAGNLSDPIQSVYQMWLVPYHFSIGTWMMLVSVVRLLMVCGMTGFFMILVQCNPPLPIGAVLAVILSAFTVTGVNSTSLWLSSLNPLRIIGVNEWMRSYIDLNVFSIPVNRTLIIIVLSLITVLISFLLPRFVKHARLNRKTYSSFTHSSRMSTSIAGNIAEQYWIIHKGLLCLVAVIVAVVIWMPKLHISKSLVDLHYQQYAQQLSGVKTEEKDVYLIQQEQFVLSSQDITEEQRLGFFKAKQQYDLLEQDGVFKDTLLLEWISGRQGLRTVAQAVMLVLSGLCFSVSMTYGKDLETGMIILQKSTCSVTQIQRLQRKNMIIHGMCLWTAVFIPVYVRMIRIFGIQGLSATYGILPCWMILILQVIAESVMIGLFMEGCRKMAERIRVSSYTVIAATSFLIACELFISMI